jgi:hypothetical protein
MVPSSGITIRVAQDAVLIFNKPRRKQVVRTHFSNLAEYFLFKIRLQAHFITKHHCPLL